MKKCIHNNVIKATDLVISAKDRLPEIAVLRDVKFTYQQDASGNRTSTVESVRYECVDPETYSSLKKKVNGAKIVITPETLQQADDIVYIEIPVAETLIKPYSIEYGYAKVSIIAPYVKLHKQ